MPIQPGGGFVQTHGRVYLQWGKVEGARETKAVVVMELTAENVQTSSTSGVSYGVGGDNTVDIVVA